MKVLFTVLSLFLVFGWAEARVNARYDIRQLPYDCRPVKNLVGLWRFQSVKGNNPSYFKPPYLLDFGINPIPKFGARALNLTSTFYDGIRNVNRSDVSFLPMKNATRRDRRVHTALLTSSSDGYTLMEQGIVTGNQRNTRLRFHLKQFLQRSFSTGQSAGLDDLAIDGLEREFLVDNRGRLQMTIQAITNYGDDDYTASYQRILN